MASISRDKVNVVTMPSSRGDDSRTDKKSVDSSSKSPRGPGLQGCLFPVTIEPAVTMTMFGIVISMLIFQNFIMDKVCNISLGYDNETCTAVLKHDYSDNHTEEVAKEVELETNKIFGWKFALDHSIPILMVLVAGPWSDKHGRKPLLILCGLGYTLAQAFLLLNVWQWTWPVEIAVIGYALLHGLGGASVVLNLSSLCYMTDITNDRNRTVRVGIMIVVMNLAVPAGSLLSPILYQLGWYYAAFGTGASCTAVAVVYTGLLVNESVSTELHKASVYKDMINVKHIVNCIRTVMKKREGWVRGKILVFIFLIFVCQFFYGEMSIMFIFLYSTFGFDIVRYSWYNTYRFVVNMLGLVLTLGVARFFGVPDPVLGIIGSMSQLGCSCLLAVSPLLGQWVLWSVPIMDMANGACLVVAKASLTGLVSGQEMGRVVAVSSVVEAIIPIVSNPAYTFVLGLTLHSAPGVAFLITAATMVVATLIFIGLHVIREKAEENVVPLSYSTSKDKGQDMDQVYVNSAPETMLSTMVDGGAPMETTG